MSESPSLILLEAAPGPDDPLGMMMACHKRLLARLETLTRVVEVFKHADEERYDQAAGAIGLVIRHLHGPARVHHEDEEISLFPRMLARDAGAAAPIHALESEHEQLEGLWSSVLPMLMALADGAELTPDRLECLEAGVAALRSGYEAHIRHEDEVIYPLAERLLSPEDLHGLGTEMSTRRQLR